MRDASRCLTPHAMPYYTTSLLSQFDDDRSRRRSMLLAAGTGAALVAIAATAATLVGRGGALARHVDRPIRRRLPGIGGPARRGARLRSPATQLVAGIGDQWTTSIVAAAGALAAARRDPRRGLPVLAAAGLSAALHTALKPLVRRPRPLVARLTGKRTSSFPSGHALRGASVFGVLAHAAAREGMMPGAVAYPVAAALAVGTGSARVAQDRHWTTDLVGGWALGTAVAAACSAWYDRAATGA